MGIRILKVILNSILREIRESLIMKQFDYYYRKKGRE